jgi:hypothetical protein
VNAKLVTLTPTIVGGDVANSLKLAGLARPVNVALTVWRLEGPTESAVVATPFTLVVLWRGLTAPNPDVTDHVTTTPGTPRPLTSTAVTLRAFGNGLLKYQFCASPPLFRRSKGGPAGWVPFPLQAHAETPATRVITRFVAMDVRTALGSGSASTRSPLQFA